jgi:hypothetical protein
MTAPENQIGTENRAIVYSNKTSLVLIRYRSISHLQWSTNLSSDFAGWTASRKTAEGTPPNEKLPLETLTPHRQHQI